MDNNLDGINANSANGDNPPPQNGACPNGGVSPITGTHSCTVFIHNYVHNNNNVNVPGQSEPPPGSVPTNSLPYAAAGTGIVIDGGRNDTMMDNLISDNDAWGVTVNPLLDSGPPCTGGTLDLNPAGSCLFDEWGDAILDNKFGKNGGYGHPTNGDIAWLSFTDGHPTPCFHGNTEFRRQPHDVADRGAADAPRLRRLGHSRQPERFVPDGGAVRFAGRAAARSSVPVPERSVPAPDARRDASAARKAADDAEPVPGRSLEPLVPSSRPQGLTALTLAWLGRRETAPQPSHLDMVCRPPSGRRTDDEARSLVRSRHLHGGGADKHRFGGCEGPACRHLSRDSRQFRTIQDAVDAARPGDWILVAPGDYHEQADHRADGHATRATGAVMVTTPGIHIRGLDRNGVVVDGTKPGRRSARRTRPTRIPVRPMRTEPRSVATASRSSRPTG